MKKYIKINNKEYEAVELTFNTVCQLEELGVSLTDATAKSMSLIRGYIALCMGSDVEKAGEEMQAHIINGGDFEEIANTLAKAIEDSGFFQAARKASERKEAVKAVKEVKEK